MIFRRLLALGACLSLALASARAASPSILITNLPSYGSAGSASGLVLNASTTSNAVLVLVYVAGDWYSKPGCANQLTPIQTNGAWSAVIGTAGSDNQATEVAAFLVPANYSAACVDAAAGLTIPPGAEALYYTNLVVPGTRRFNFAGYGWSVKSAAGAEGPGPNYFSASTNNSWVDAQGFLHLKITYTNSEWQCVEIISDRSFGYGQYRFAVNAPVDGLDANVVLGLFTWSNDSAYNDREIDMELSRWDYSFGTADVEDYAVAPYANDQVLRLALPAITNSTHSFIWQSNSIAFQTLSGAYAASPAATNILQRWTCTDSPPPAGGEQVHINFWLDKGNPPVNGQPVEVVLTNFEFVPLGAAQPAVLGRLTGPPAASPQLTLQGVADWHYELFASSNLLTWTGLGTILATNNVFQFLDTNAVASPARFYRALTDP